MDIQEILSRGEGEVSSAEELKAVLHSLSAELDTLKESNPEQYLVLVTQLQKVLKELNSTLRKV